MATLKSIKKYLQFTVVVIVFFALVAVRQLLGNNNEQGQLAQLGAVTPSQTNSLQINPPIRVRGGEDDDLRESFQRVPTTQPSPTPVTPSQLSIPTQLVASGLYKDGTYTGPVADAFYGNIQVQVAVTGGKISSVTFLQYPSDTGTSRYISSQAMPLLQAEAIKAQSARVDVVSGASATSAAFRQSLGVALQQAKV